MRQGLLAGSLRGHLSLSRLAVIALSLAAALTAFAQSPSKEAEPFLRAARQSLEANPNSPYSPSTIIVRFEASVGERGRAAARALVGGPSIQKFEHLVPGLEVIGTRMSPELAVRVLSAQPGVRYAELDYTVHGQVIPNDPGFGNLWGMNNTGQSGGTVDADIDAPEAWDLFTGSPNFVIADIDTGMQLNHPDLAANLWVNPGEIPGNGIDDDHNGFVDDVNGWNFYANNNNPNDDNGHGTHTAGTLGAVGNNGVGVAGVNWNCKIMPLKFLGANGSGTTSAAIAAVNYAVMMGVKVSNNSWGGGGFDQGLYDAINAGKSVGHLFCAAAGNSSSNNDVVAFYPANYTLDNVISVASTDRLDNLSSFSDYGATTVDLGAPGSSIYSTYPTSTYATLSGTSMATPHVAGICALLYGYHPTWTYGQIRNALFGSVRPISALSGKCVTGGVANAFAALQFGSSTNTPPTVTISSPANNSSFNQGDLVTFTGTANDTQDGNLTSGLTWTSNLQGVIGTGGTFSRSDLLVGTHVVTASVTDTGGLSGSAAVTVTIVVPSATPAAPSGLTVLRLSAGTAFLSWSDNSGNEDGFRIERQKRVGNVWTNTTTYTVAANTTSALDAAGSGRFRYRIQAFNASGSSAWTGYVSVKL